MQTLPSDIDPQCVDVWFQDEARVGQRGTVCRIWSEVGLRPRLIRQQQYEYAYVFGAICPASGQAVGMVMPSVEHEAMQTHLNEISKAISPGRHAVLIMDRAPWHITQKLSIPKNISILPLPAYSPELNPVEQIWQWLRQHHWANRVFESYESIVDACCDAWNTLCSLPQTIKSIGMRQWANLYS